MPVYLVAIMTRLKDLAIYEDYRGKIEPTMRPYGGRFILRGTPMSVEGEPLGRMAVIEFQDLDAARRWYNSPEYRPLREERARAADVNAGIIEGYDELSR